MIPVKTYPKFKCEFCKKKSVSWRMEQHEKVCYYNPNRVCDHRSYDPEDGMCHSCAIADEAQTKIKDTKKIYEENQKQFQEESIEELPF